MPDPAAVLRRHAPHLPGRGAAHAREHQHREHRRLGDQRRRRHRRRDRRRVAMQRPCAPGTPPDRRGPCRGGHRDRRGDPEQHIGGCADPGDPGPRLPSATDPGFLADQRRDLHAPGLQRLNAGLFRFGTHRTSVRAPEQRPRQRDGLRMYSRLLLDAPLPADRAVRPRFRVPLPGLGDVPDQRRRASSLRPRAPTLLSPAFPRSRSPPPRSIPSPSRPSPSYSADSSTPPSETPASTPPPTNSGSATWTR